MKVSIRIGYTEYLADLSGAELESLTKTLSKMAEVVNSYTLAGKDVSVVPDNYATIKAEIKLLTGPVTTITRSKYEAEQAKAQKAARHDAVVDLFAGRTDQSGFLDTMYINGGLTYQQKKSGSVKHFDEDAVLVCMDDGSSVQINLNGDITTNPTAE